MLGHGKPALANLMDGTKSVVKGTYATKAESLCRDAYRKADAIAQPGNSLRALTVPPGDEGTVAEMLGAQDKVIARDKERLAAAQARNQAAWDRVEEAEAPLVVAANAKFDAYGLRNCGTLSAF